MLDVLRVTFPFFALVLCGYLAARRQMLPFEAIPGLNGFVLYFALPCMLFRFGASTPIAQPVTQPMAPAPFQSVEAPKMQPPAAVAVSLENNYIASVRATLNANKRYPTGREASLQRPSGKVKVWFVLLRNGSLQEAGIDESSNSIILDINSWLRAVIMIPVLSLPK